MIQYLIETIENIRCPAISAVTFAFLSDTLSKNFDDYLNQKILKVSQNMGAEKKSSDEKSLEVVEVPDDIDCPLRIESQVNSLFPQRETTSRFSIRNPRARFSTAHEDMRKTIKEYQEHGRPADQLNEDDYGEEEPVGRAMNQHFMSRLNLVAHPINEELLNQTMNDTFLTCFNIDDLFMKAEKMEQAQYHNDDDFFNEMNLYKNIEFKEYAGPKIA